MTDAARVLAVFSLTISVGLVITMVTARALRLRRESTVQRDAPGLRAELVRLLASDDDETPVPRVGRRRQPLFEALAIELIGKVRGEGRDRLAASLVETGAVAAAERRCRRWVSTTRATAADFLGTAGHRPSAGAVRPLLRDRSVEVRSAAARALGRIGDGSDVPRLLACLEGEAERAVPFTTIADALIELGAPAIPGVRDGLRSATVVIRAVSSEVLGLLGAVDAAEDLLAHLHPVEDDEVRIRCSRALGRIGTPRAVGPLARLTSPSEPTAVRAIAAQALGRVGGQAAAVALGPVLDDESHTVARNAAAALVACGPPGRAVLRARVTRAGPGADYAREALARAAIHTHELETAPSAGDA
jgi:HEAT repeat protein